MAGRRGRKSSRKKTMFYKKPRHPEIAKIVRIDSPTAARKSARTLVKMAEKNPRRRLVIKRAMVLARNRALASAKRKNLSAKERRELKEVARIYEQYYKRI